MKRSGLLAIIISIAIFPATPVSAQDQAGLNTLKEKQSYAMGAEMLRNLKRQGFDFDLDALIKGMKDANTGGKLALNDDDMLQTLNLSASQARVNRTSEQLLAGLDNRKAEEEFMAANQVKEGVVTLASGLQYRIIRDGRGKKPSAGDTVEVNYRGTLIDHTVFESTYDNGHPATIRVSDPHVIAGLREALKLMPTGAKWEIYIPSHLAYGQRPAGRSITPYSMLTYELELLRIS